MRRMRWFIAVPALLAALAVGGTWFYIHVVSGDVPARLTLVQSSGTPTAPAAPATVDGTWAASSGSQVGYRVKEVLLGQNATAVGRTSKVTGSLTITGTNVTAAAFTVDMTSVTSAESRRDNQFRGRIMDTSQFPTATFTLTAPIALTTTADGRTVTTKATGALTLHGVTKPVTFEVLARRTGGRIDVNGSIPITFADWGVDNPSAGPAQVGDTGELEFLLVFTKA